MANVINGDFVPVHALEDGEPGLSTSDEVSDLQHEYNVASYPTLVIVDGNRRPAMSTGYSDKRSVETFLSTGWKSDHSFVYAPTLKGFQDEMERNKRGGDGGSADAGRSVGASG